MTILRPTGPTDRPAVLDMIRLAFGRGGEEVGIVEAVWRSPRHAPALDLVAERDGVVVGHILHSHGDLADMPILGLAPLAVRPDAQGQGVGSALVREALRIADMAGEPAVIVLGHPGYYLRFGFEPASALGITYGPLDRRPDKRPFMVRRLHTFTPALRGVYRYAWEL